MPNLTSHYFLFILCTDSLLCGCGCSEPCLFFQCCAMCYQALCQWGQPHHLLLTSWDCSPTTQASISCVSTAGRDEESEMIWLRLAPFFRVVFTSVNVSENLFWIAYCAMKILKSEDELSERHWWTTRMESFWHTCLPADCQQGESSRTHFLPIWCKEPRNNTSELLLMCSHLLQA